ncbi:MAG: HlyD family efflux transporter periplasmic adaptor subunit [Xanthomonadaceae bacterium]|nr:HlyD family efflux transporter periplasmic adaptor subunit [Xanthomonadaceae bacterium]
MTRRVLAIAFVALLGACSHESDPPVLETVASGPVTLSVAAHGELKSAAAAPMLVPGPQWAQRQLVWAVPDGTWVKKDEVVARFTAPQSKLQLSDALLDLERNTLALAGKQQELDVTRDKLGVDMAQVEGQLAIAHRYASAGELALARDKILDAVQDEHFLGIKQGVLGWQQLTASERGKADIALLDAQRGTNQVTADQRRADLAALEIRAPHDGLLLLQADWSGEKPRVGSAMWAGNAFATLPDTAKMEVELYLPQIQSEGLKPGLAVELSPSGAPDQKMESSISWVAAAAAPRSRESPVKYLAFKATVPADAVTRFHWAPGQIFDARVILLHADNAITVPNIAVRSQGGSAQVSVMTGGHLSDRKVQLGVRGPSRSQVLSGLAPGDRLVVLAAESAPAAVPPRSAP